MVGILRGESKEKNHFWTHDLSNTRRSLYRYATAILNETNSGLFSKTELSQVQNFPTKILENLIRKVLKVMCFSFQSQIDKICSFPRRQVAIHFTWGQISTERKKSDFSFCGEFQGLGLIQEQEWGLAWVASYRCIHNCTPSASQWLPLAGLFPFNGVRSMGLHQV